MATFDRHPRKGTKMRLSASLLISAVIAMLLGFVVSTDTPTAQTPNQGFQYGARISSAYFLYANDTEVAKTEINKVLDMAQAAGVDTINVPVAWAGVDLGDHREESYGDGEAFRGRYIWDSDIYGHEDNHFDNLLGEAERRDLAVNLQIEATPDWVHPYLKDQAAGCDDPNNSNLYCKYDYRYWHPPRGGTELQHFANFTEDLAKHVEGEYPGLVDQYEIWNEPNNKGYWQPQSTPDPAEYADLLRSAYISVKEVDSNADIVFGGIALNHLAYLEKYYQAVKDETRYPDAASNNYYFDVLGVHPYVHPKFETRSPDEYTQDVVTTEDLQQDGTTYTAPVEGNFLGFREMKRIMDEEEMVGQGDAGKSLYLSEFGYRSPPPPETYGVSDQRRALFLKRAFELARSYPYVEGMTWHAFSETYNTETQVTFGPCEWAIVYRYCGNGSTMHQPSLTYRAHKQVTGAEASNAEVSINLPQDVSGIHSIEPQLTNLSASEVSRWELYVDGRLLKEQTTAPIEWDTSQPVDGKQLNGSHSVMVAAYTTEGSVWHSNFAETYVDNTGLEMGPPAILGLDTSKQLGVSKVPVMLEWWQGGDGGSSVDHYELQESTDNGTTYSDVSLPDSGVPSSTGVYSITLWLEPGQVHSFRVRAQDRAGNWSSWKTSVGYEARAYQENSPNISYPVGNWTRQQQNSAYGGYVKYETASGARARFTFFGSEIALVSSLGSNRGKAEVCVDPGTAAAKCTIVNLYSPTAKARQIVFDKVWQTSNSHTVTVRVLGTSGRPRVDVDGFVTFT